MRIKNNEEVQSYPSKVAQALPFCRIVDPSRNQEHSAFVVQMIWLLRKPAFLTFSVFLGSLPQIIHDRTPWNMQYNNLQAKLTSMYFVCGPRTATRWKTYHKAYYFSFQISALVLHHNIFCNIYCVLEFCFLCMLHINSSSIITYEWV